MSLKFAEGYKILLPCMPQQALMPIKIRPTMPHEPKINMRKVGIHATAAPSALFTPRHLPRALRWRRPP